MVEVPKVNAQLICQLAALNGLELSLDRAEALVPALREILTVDAQITQLFGDPVTTVDRPSPQEASGHDIRS